MIKSTIKIMTLYLLGMTAALAGTVEQDINTINTHWENGQDQAILMIINNRLATDQNDIFALSLKYNYYLYCQMNILEVRSAVDTLETLFSLSENQKLIDYISILKERAYTIPLSESTPFSAAEKDTLRRIFDSEFPNITESAKLVAESSN